MPFFTRPQSAGRAVSTDPSLPTVRLPGSQVAIPVQLLVGTDAAVATTNLNYTATAGRTGQTR